MPLHDMSIPLFVACPHLCTTPDEGLAYLRKQVSSLKNTGLPADELMGSKIDMLDKCMWTASSLVEILSECNSPFGGFLNNDF